MAASTHLRPAFRGPVHLPGEPAYDAHRATWSGKIDPRPAVVAEASTPSDVRAAVLIAQEHGLPFAVQSTGHGTHVPSDGGLLLKTSQMAEVLVDPDRRIARVGPGAVWGDVIAAAAPCGLAPVTGSSPAVGVAGFTLGGGVGWLSRALGFAADSLLRVDIVTADGRLVRASADQNADLFWAPMGYADTATLGGTPPRQFELFADLPDAVIAAAVDAVTRADTPANALELRHWGGAMARPGADAGPVGHRDVPFSITVDGPAEAAAALTRHATGGSFLNFLQDPSRTHTAYTATDHRRLRGIKRAHDPGNVFGLTHNIPPAAGEQEHPVADGARARA